MNTILRTQNKNLIFFASKNIKHRYSIHFEFSPSITFYNNVVRFNHENIRIIKHKQMSFRIGNMFVKYFYYYSIPREGNYLRVNRVILNITKGKRITINNEVNALPSFQRLNFVVGIYDSRCKSLQIGAYCVHKVYTAGRLFLHYFTEANGHLVRFNCGASISTSVRFHSIVTYET